MLRYIALLVSMLYEHVDIPSLFLSSLKDFFGISEKVPVLVFNDLVSFCKFKMFHKKIHQNCKSEDLIKF